MNLNEPLLMIDGQPISAAMLRQWLKEDWVGRAIYQSYLDTRKAGGAAYKKLKKDSLKRASCKDNV